MFHTTVILYNIYTFKGIFGLDDLIRMTSCTKLSIGMILHDLVYEIKLKIADHHFVTKQEGHAINKMDVINQGH